MPNTEAIPHTITVSINPDGDREYDWPHPATCPDGDTCNIQFRIRRAGTDYMSELMEGRPVGVYRLGRIGFYGLCLIDDNGQILPDVTEALSPAAQAARQIAAYVITELAEAICDDTERLVELSETIRRGQTMDQWEHAANEAVDTIIREHLGTMRAFADPIRPLLKDAS